MGTTSATLFQIYVFILTRSENEGGACEDEGGTCEDDDLIGTPGPLGVMNSDSVGHALVGRGADT